MRRTSSLLIVVSLAIILSMSSISASTANEPEKPAAGVHIVYVNRPENEDPEAFHIRALASVVGSEEAAREAVVYHYKHAASGFSARLTPKQAADLSQHPGVLQVQPEKKYQLF